MALIALLPAAAPPVGAEAYRLALVIGNGAYAQAPLANPANDAGDLAARLRALGFEVDLRRDADRRTMEQAIGDFNRRLTGDGKVGLFYFAGHAAELEGRNFLIPIGANINDAVDLRYEAVDAGRVLDGMGAAGNGLNLVVLDACRNNPYRSATRSLSRGLARMSPAKGTLVLYATQPGAVAQDGSGRNGVFTKHLLAALEQPGLEVEQVFKRTAQAVDQETGGAQTPWVEGVVLGQFAFTPATTAATLDPAPAPAPTQVTQAPTPAPIPPPPAPLAAPVGYLQVNVNTAAQVQVDGRPVGSAAPGQPLNLQDLAVGEHQVTVSAPGYTAQQKSVRLEAGRWTQDLVTLEAQTAAAPAPTPPPPLPEQEPTRTAAPPTPRSPRYDPAPPSAATQTYVVNRTDDGFVSVRAGPGSNYAELQRLRGGTRVACGEAVGGETPAPGAHWRYCPKVGGYMYAALLTRADATPTGRRFRVRDTSDGFVAVRSEPSTSRGRRVAKLHDGDLILCDQWDQGGQWLRCPSVGGWVYAALLDEQ